VSRRVPGGQRRREMVVAQRTCRADLHVGNVSRRRGAPSTHRREGIEPALRPASQVRLW
jgi:hypothetical protein